MNEWVNFDQWWQYIGSNIKPIPSDTMETHAEFVARMAFEDAIGEDVPQTWEPNLLVYTPRPFEIELSCENRRKNIGQPLKDANIVHALSVAQTQANNAIKNMMRS